MNPTVLMKTSLGEIRIELFETEAPISTKNFLSYVDKSFYDGTLFHRVIDDFMIQGGGFDAGFKEKSTDSPIKNEATNGVKNQVGTLAMARTNVVDSATSQFFINVKDNSFLDHRSTNPPDYGYAVFGRVVDGLEVIDKIKKVRTGSKSGHGDVPLESVMIESIKRA